MRWRATSEVATESIVPAEGSVAAGVRDGGKSGKKYCMQSGEGPKVASSRVLSLKNKAENSGGGGEMVSALFLNISFA